MARKQTVTETVEETVVDNATEETVSAASTKAPRKQLKVKNNLTPETLITVRNGFNGKLIYKSKRYGEVFEWEEFGDEQELELQELKNAKNSYKAFFENNWFLIDNPEVIDYLGIDRYYKNSLNFEEFDTIFKQTPDEIEDRIRHLPDGQKVSLAYRCKQLISDGTVDSLKVINTLEKSLGIELIEK